MTRRLPLILLLVAGIFGIVPFLMPHRIIQNIDEVVRNDFLRIIGAFALILGLGSLLRHHIDKIRRKRPDWAFSWVLVVSFVVTSVIGLFGGIGGRGIMPTAIGSFHFDIQAIYMGILVPLGSTMFALLAFFMTSAAYRAFRARSLEATLLLLAAFVVMLAMIPIGPLIHPRLPDFAQWLLDIPNVASKRGITFGVALGALATELKILLGIERSWLGGGK